MPIPPMAPRGVFLSAPECGLCLRHFPILEVNVVLYTLGSFWSEVGRLIPHAYSSSRGFLRKTLLRRQKIDREARGNQ